MATRLQKGSRRRRNRPSNEKITARNRLRNIRLAPIRKQGIRVNEARLPYKTTNGASRSIGVVEVDPDTLPKTPDPQLKPLLRDMTKVRSRLSSSVLSPIVKQYEAIELRRLDGKLYARDRNKMIRTIERVAQESLRREVISLRNSVKEAATRGIRESAKDLRDLGITVAMDRTKVDRRVREVMRQAESNIAQGISALQKAHQRLRDHAGEIVDSTEQQYRRRKNRFKRRVIDTDENYVVDGGSLSRSIQRIRRTEYQRAHQQAALVMCQEHGIKHVHWRLSVNHKSYGGREICEVLAAGTGSIAKRSSLSQAGLYHINEVPSLPHPNCMCQIEPAG